MANTTGAAWRKAVEVPLPSGNVALLRKPDVFNLVMGDGDVPEFFSAQVMAGLKGKAAPEAAAPETADDLRGYSRLLDTVARACFVHPRIVDKPEGEMGEDEIGLEHLAFADKVAVFQWAMGGEESRAAQSFLEKQGAGLDALRAGDDVPAESGGPAGAE